MRVAFLLAVQLAVLTAVNPKALVPRASDCPAGSKLSGVSSSLVGGVLAPYGCFFGPTPPRIAQAQAVAELEKYAAKLEARVG